MPTIRKHSRRRPWTKPAVRAKNAPGDGVRRFKPDDTPRKGWEGCETGANKDPRLKTARWQRVRKSVLFKDPLCIVCDHRGRIEPAVTVDHIEPRVDDFHNFYDPVNLWGLCDTCHRIKSRLELSGARYLERLEWITHINVKRAQKQYNRR